jgi:transketolase
VAPQKPLKEDAPIVDIGGVKLSSPPSYKIGESVATRFAYGTALSKIATSNSRVIALDGDTKNSTYSDRLKKVRILQSCFILYRAS